MQVGRETEAKSLFDTAFAADPFNVRADNMIKVLAAHGFLLRASIRSTSACVIDPTQDELLGRYMSKYLESIVPRLTTRFGYSPPGKTQDRDPQEPPVVQRADGRPAVRPDSRCLYRQSRRAGQPSGNANPVQLGTSARPTKSFT